MKEEIIHTPFSLPGPNDALIRGDVRISDQLSDDLPTLVICHGFRGYKDWGFFPYLSSELAKKGFAAVTINFSHNGMGEDDGPFTEIERFKANCFALECEDVKRVLEAIRSGSLPHSERIKEGDVGLIGHSRGGVAVLSTAANDSGVSGVATLASIADFPTVTDEEEKEWRETGARMVVSSRTKQDLPMGLSILEEITKQRDMIKDATQQISIPLLIIHGESDTSVPVSAAHMLAGWARHHQLAVLEGADHSFGVRHPFTESTPHMDRVIDLLGTFFSV